jgi:hypothetical protein
MEDGLKYIAHGGYTKCIQNLSENLKGRDHLEEIGTDLRIIKYVLRTQPLGM